MLIRREKKYANLLDAYNLFQQTGKFQLRLITGEAGTGKTVLTNMLMDDMEEKAEQTLFVSSFCCIRSEYNIPYQPFKELLKQLLYDVKEEENTSKKKLKDALMFSARMICEHAPDLIGSFIPGATILNVIGKTVLKEKDNKDAVTIEETKILEQYRDAIKAIAEKYKLVIFIDDLQWLDNLSVNLLYQLIMGLQNSPVMFIGAYRSTDISSEGVNHPINKLLTEVKISFGNVFINLDTESESERKAFMNTLLDVEKNIYDSCFREKLFERTNGNPLFVVELISLLKDNNMIIQNNDGVWMNNASLVWNSYPVRIEGIIQERIGKLEDSLVEILSHASVQGYNFIAQVLSKTMGEPEKDVLMTLSKKLQKQYNLVYERNCTRSNKGLVSHFNFSNYIFQQYLYQELSMSQRIMLHSDIAEILEELFKGNYDEVAADIAKHYEISGENEKALHYMKITIESMMRISAYEEAAVVINKSLAILNDMEQSAEMKKELLWFIIKLSICYRSTKGWGSPEVEKLYYQAKELSKEIGMFEYMDIISFGLWTIHLTRLELDKCLHLAYKNLYSAQKHGNKQSEMNAYVSLANTLFWMGNIVETQEHLDAFDKMVKSDDVTSERLDMVLHNMFNMLIAYQCNDDEKVTCIKDLFVQMIETEKDLFCKVVAYQALSWLAFLTENESELGFYSKQLLELSDKYNFLMYSGIGKMFYGAWLIDSNEEEALSTIKQGYQILMKHCGTDRAVMHILYGFILSKSYLKVNKGAEFLSFTNQVIEKAIERNEKCYLNELYLLKAIYFKENNEEAKMQEFLKKSLDIAKAQGSLRGELKVKSFIN